jgi:hypothetical protein
MRAIRVHLPGVDGRVLVVTPHAWTEALLSADDAAGIVLDLLGAIHPGEVDGARLDAIERDCRRLRSRPGERPPTAAERLRDVRADPEPD